MSFESGELESEVARVASGEVLLFNTERALHLQNCSASGTFMQYYSDQSIAFKLKACVN